MVTQKLVSDNDTNFTATAYLQKFHDEPQVQTYFERNNLRVEIYPTTRPLRRQILWTYGRCTQILFQESDVW